MTSNQNVKLQLTSKKGTTGKLVYIDANDNQYDLLRMLKLITMLPDFQEKIEKELKIIKECLKDFVKNS